MRLSIASTALSGLGLSSIVMTTSAWTSTTTLQTRAVSAAKATVLFNVPPPSQEDTKAFKEFANKQSPPASFFELQQDCIRSSKMAIEDGCNLLEVEFPPLPANILELDDIGAYEVAQANLQLAVDFAKGFTVDGGNVAILLPDEAEARIQMERYTGNKNLEKSTKYEIEAGIFLSSLRKSDEGDDRLVKVRNSKTSRYWFSNEG